MTHFDVTYSFTRFNEQGQERDLPTTVVRAKEQMIKDWDPEAWRLSYAHNNAHTGTIMVSFHLSGGNWEGGHF